MQLFQLTSRPLFFFGGSNVANGFQLAQLTLRGQARCVGMHPIPRGENAVVIGIAVAQHL